MSPASKVGCRCIMQDNPYVSTNSTYEGNSDIPASEEQDFSKAQVPLSVTAKTGDYSPYSHVNLPPEAFDSYKSAGFFPRLFAYIIDSILALLLASVLFSIVTLLFSIPFPNADSYMRDVNLFFSLSASDIIMYLLYIAYFAVSTATTGATPGKKLMRLRVVSTDGGRISWFSAIYRETVGRYLSSILFIGYFWLIWDRKKRALHDHLADTRVIYSL